MVIYSDLRHLFEGYFNPVTAAIILSYLHKYGSQAWVSRLRNIVLDALVMSVICKPPFVPPVKFFKTEDKISHD